MIQASTQTYGSPAGRMMGEMIDVQAWLVIFAVLVLIASAGAIVGFLTRKMIVLIGIGFAILAFLMFHMYLPLPVEIQADIMRFKGRIGLL